MEIYNINLIIEAVLLLLLYFLYKFSPNNAEVRLKLKALEKKCMQLSENLEVDRTEMWEHIEGTLKPLTQRLRTRIARAEKAEEKDLSKQSSFQHKGGIIGYRKKI